MVAFNIIWSEEIASILNIDVKTLYDNRWKNRTGCPIRRYGGRIGAKREEFFDWLSNFGVLVHNG